MKAMVPSVGLLLLLAVVAAGIGTAEPQDAAVRVTSLSVERLAGGITVRIKTSGPAKYQSSFLDSPNRLVVDLPGATYTWNKATLNSDAEPVRQVRGSQWKSSMARVVVELSRKVGYRIDEDANGLLIVLEPDGTAQAEKAAAKPRETKAKIPPAPTEAWAPRVETPRIEARAAAPAKPPGAPDREVMATVTVAPLPAVEAKAAPVPARIAQAGPSTPSGQAPLGDKLISLDFRDADIVTLLRVLAAESGRNIVAGDDVKGKVSVSLHNVTWEQALNTILETRGLQRLDRNGIIRIVTTEQLTKERDAQARVQDALVKAETDARTRRAEAELKEAEATSKKFQSEAKMADAQARGPLREEAIRLSYADPGEVANTLQGILSFGQQGSKIEPCRTFEFTRGEGETLSTLKVTATSGGGASSGPIAEPPFSQLFGPPRPPEQAPPPPPAVFEDVAAKVLAIRAHCPTNTLFLRLYAADLERVKKLIKESFDIPLPQVKIEARMEILDRSAYEAIGVQWGGAGAGNINNTTTIIGQGFQTPLNAPPSVGPPPTQVGPQFAPNNPQLNLSQLFPISPTTALPLGGNVVNLPFGALPGAAAAGAPAGGIAFGLVSGNFNINLALQALANQGKTRTLARPEIVTLEGSRAVMTLGEQIPYLTVSSAGTQVQLKRAALNLEVIPTVVREQVGQNVVTKIKMQVLVENNSRGENTAAGPIINERRAVTQVLIKAGDRLVVGGVTQAQSSTTVRKVPLFGDIPIFGWLFKQKEDTETGRELVIFVTPSLITGQGTAGMANTPLAPK